MDRLRILIAIILSAVVLIGWPVIMHRFFPQPPEEPPQSPALQAPASIAKPDNPVKAPVAPLQPAGSAAKPVPAVTQVPERELTIITPYSENRFTNRGAVATSWILKKEKKPDGTVRTLTGADDGQLQLIPQEGLDKAGAPLSLRIPSSPELTKQVNEVNYQIDGLSPGQTEVNLSEGEKREIAFTYASAGTLVRKTFTFYGDGFVFDVKIEVKSTGAAIPADIVIGPRIGDQSDQQTGSYSYAPEIVAYTRDDKFERLPGSKITPPFTKIRSLDEAGKRIELESPLAGDVDQVRIVGADGASFLGYARVVDAELGRRLLTLDSLPQGTAVGDKVAQGTDTLRRGYRWAGIVNHYFTMIAVPARPVDDLVLTNLHLKLGDGSQPPKEFPSVAVPVPPPPGGSAAEIHIFIGPKDRELIAQVGEQLGTDLSGLIDYGFFSPIIRPLVPLIAGALNWSAKLFHNYGWGIVLVTVGINILLFPLRLHSSRKMKNAARHQPRLKELQERLKKLKADNPKKHEREIEQVQREQVELMKEANPLGGCLPMLLQMPIFWAFYLYLLNSLDVRHEAWVLWIKDLSASDPLKILPVVMCVTMIGSTMLQPQPATADPSQKTQRLMMTWLMPIILTWFFFFKAPSGLVLYWMVSNLVGVVFQFAINRYTTVQPAEAPKAAEPVSQGKKSVGGRKRKVSEKQVVGGVK